MIKKNPTLTFDVSTLMNVGTGTSERFSFEGPVVFEGIDVQSPIKGKMEIMRIEEGVNARVEDVELTIGLICTKCMGDFNSEIYIESAERLFLFDIPDKVEDLNDIFLIDKKKQEIEVTEPLRQEIILHFPSIPVCYTSCKGICPVCWQNKNEKECQCAEETGSDHKPLAALKDLLK